MKQSQFYCKLDAINMANKVATDIVNSIHVSEIDGKTGVSESLGATLSNVQKAQALFSRCANELLTILDVSPDEIEVDEKE